MRLGVRLRAFVIVAVAAAGQDAVASGTAGPPVTLHIQGASAPDALTAFERATGTPVEALWADDEHAEGLDPNMIVNFDCRAATATAALESLLRRLDARATWQIGADGLIEVGPRSRLNDHRTTRIYEVRDLLQGVPDYTDVPTIDLSAALEAHSSSPFRDDDTTSERPAKPDSAKDLISLITTTIEPDQWLDNGGVATIRVYHNSLLITAPNYIHRQLETHPSDLPHSAHMPTP